MSTIIRFIISKESIDGTPVYYQHYDNVRPWGCFRDDATAYKTYGEAEGDIEEFIEPGTYSIDKVFIKHGEPAYEKS